MDGSKSPPSKDMLPPFRVRQARPPTGDGVIRMKKLEYDELLKTQPTAALMYMDESDGEVILVGSSFELDQRLQEPVHSAPRPYAGVTLDLYAAGSKPLHTFDVEKSEDVIQTWQKLDSRTTEEGKKARNLFFGRKEAPVTPSKKNEQVAAVPAKETVPANETIPAKEVVPANETIPASITPKKEIVQAPAPSTPVRFGQPSPPRSSLEASLTTPKGCSHASRWEGYSNMPASFHHATIPVSPSEPEEKESITAPSPILLVNDSEQAMPLASAPKPERNSASFSFTLDHPAPSLDTFWTTEQKEEKEQQEQAEKQEFRPLLNMFEKQLHKLGSAPATGSERTNSTTPTSITPNSIAVRMPETPSLQPTPIESLRLHGPGELLTQSIQSLLSGMGQLASAFKLTNSELQQQVSIAQRDFPNNVERAIKSSAASIDSLIQALSQAQSSRFARPIQTASQRVRAVQRLGQPRVRFSDQVAPAAADNNANTATEKEPSENQGNDQNVEMQRAQQSSAAIMRELQARAAEKKAAEEKSQNDRVDRAVEEMRLSLLAIGWRAPATHNRIYTRADVLEDFLAYFKKMKDDLPKVQNETTEQETPKVESKIADETDESVNQASTVVQQHPYAWDLCFDLNADEAREPINHEDDLTGMNIALPHNSVSSAQSAGSAISSDTGSTSEATRTFDGADAEIRRLIDSKAYWKPLQPSKPTAAPFTFEPHFVMRKNLPILSEETPTTPTGTNPVARHSVDDIYKAPEHDCVKCDARFYHLATLKHHLRLKHAKDDEIPPRKAKREWNEAQSEEQGVNNLLETSPAELADESILKKYPPVSQLINDPMPTVQQHAQEHPSHSAFTPPGFTQYPLARAFVPGPAVRAPRPRLEVKGPGSWPQAKARFAPVPSIKPAAVVEPKPAVMGERGQHPSTLWERSSVFGPTLPLRDAWSRPAGSLAPQASMPALSTAFTQAKNVGGDSFSANAAKTNRYEPVGRARTTIRKATSTSNLAFNRNGLARANTVAVSATDHMKGERAIKMITDIDNIVKCQNQLVAMGFERSRAETVSEAVMGDMERAIDVLDEDETARRQAKGKGKGKGWGKTMPGSYGSYDEELYG